MKFSHVKDAIRGKDKRIEELEEALRHCLLACEAVLSKDDLLPAMAQIEEKCKQALDKA